MCPEKRALKVRHRSGYVYFDKKEECWIARTTVTDESGKRRNVKRRAENKSAAREKLKVLRSYAVEENVVEKGRESAQVLRRRLHQLRNRHAALGECDRSGKSPRRRGAGASPRCFHPPAASPGA